MNEPVLILVSGPPAAGKSTVARRLVDRFGVALIAKDTCKEELYDAEQQPAGGDRRDLSRRAGTLALQRAARHLARGESVVLEGNWRPAEHGAAIAALAREQRSRLLQIQCRAAGGLLLERYVARARSGARHAVHADLETLPRLRAELLQGHYEPLPLDGPLLCIDTGAATADTADPEWLDAVARLLQR